MSSQPTWSCQGPLPSHALPVPARALREQFERRLGAHFLFGVRRQSTTQPIAGWRGEFVVSYDWDTSVLDPSTYAGAATLVVETERLCASGALFGHVGLAMSALEGSKADVDVSTTSGLRWARRLREMTRQVAE
jgi:hypothetical protein